MTVYLISAAKAFANIGWKFYLVFIIVPALALPIIVLYFPETKGLTLEEVGALFGDKLAMDITHLSDQARIELDKNLENMDVGEKGTYMKQQWTEDVQRSTVEE